MAHYDLRVDAQLMTVRYRAPFDVQMRIIGCLGVLLAGPLGLAILIENTVSPSVRRVTCERAVGDCRATALWSHLSDERIPLSALTNPHVAYTKANDQHYACARLVTGTGYWELTAGPLFGNANAAALEKAAAALQAFVGSNAPSVTVEFPIDRPDLSGVAMGLLVGPLLAWFGFLRKRPVSLSLTLDKSSGIARLRRSYYLFWVTNTSRLTTFSGVEERKPWIPAMGGSWNTTGWLRFGKRAWPLLPRYATGAADDGLALAKRIDDWIKNEWRHTDAVGAAS